MSDSLPKIEESFSKNAKALKEQKINKLSKLNEKLEKNIIMMKVGNVKDKKEDGITCLCSIKMSK
jgi:hypothetical protein